MTLPDATVTVGVLGAAYVARMTPRALVSGPARSPAPSRLYRVLDALPFVLSHVAIFGLLWSGVTRRAVLLGLGLYAVRVLGLTLGYHRYFAHRAFKTSRAFQFVLALVAQLGSQRGVLWWAAHHRAHHKYADRDGDVHSPVLRGFWYSHMGWIFDGNDDTRWDKIQDFARYPELVWLNRYWGVPPVALAVACLAFAGWPGLFLGFFASMVAAWHATFLVNSLAHVVGTRRFETRDQSRNNWLIALLMFGEGWHNNHHAYQRMAMHGHRWWEFDVTYMQIRVLEKLGLIWNVVHDVPNRKLHGTVDHA